MEKIKEYKLPLLERFAHHYQWINSILIIILSCAIILPVIAVNDWDLWYLLFFLPFILLSAIFLFNVGRWFYYRAKHAAWRKEVRSSPNHASIFAGAPGTGKSLTGVASVYEMAKYSWEELKYEHWLICAKMKKKNYVLTEDDKEILDAYEFYTTHDGVPALASNIPIYSKEFKRKSYKLEFAHLAQIKRLPYRVAALVDEIGTMVSVDGAKKRQAGDDVVIRVANIARLCRHFCELRFVGTEQDAKNIFIDVRRVVAENRVYKSHKLVLKPVFLTWLYNRLKGYFTNKGTATSFLFAKFMIRFKQFLNATGFHQFKYGVSVNTETGQTVSTAEKGVFYISCMLPFTYNSRCYRSAYQALEKPIELEVFDTLSLSRAEAQKMMRQGKKKETEGK